MRAVRESVAAKVAAFFTGLRVGIGRAVNAMITAELFFAAANLGQMLKNSGNAFDTTAPFAVILFVSLFGLACQEGMRFKQLVLGFLLGCAVGIVLGTVMGRSPLFDGLLQPWVSMMFVTSITSLVPLFIT